MARPLSYVKGAGSIRGIPGSTSGHRAVEPLLFNDPQHSPSHYLGASMGVRLRIDAQGYINGLRGVMAEHGDFPGVATVASGAADELRDAIRRHTPIGPYRDTSMSKADKLAGILGGSGVAIDDVYDRDAAWPAGPVTFDQVAAMSSRYESDARKLEADLREVEAQLAFVNGIGGRKAGSSLKWAQRFVAALTPEEAAYRKGKSLRRAKLAKVRGRHTVVAGQLNASGKLHDSIVVKGTATRGAALLVATSTSHYAWFVEHGVVQAMTPTWDISSRAATRINLSQLGNYPYFVRMINDRKEERGSDSDWLGFVFSGNTLGYEVTQRKGDSGGLNYRIGGKAARGFSPPTSFKGAHMFEKGFNDFRKIEVKKMEKKFKARMAAAFARG